MPTDARRTPYGLACVAALMLAGCGGGPEPNLSPTPEADPARYEAALKATEAMNRKAREIEKAAMKRGAMPAPPGGHPAP